MPRRYRYTKEEREELKKTTWINIRMYHHQLAMKMLPKNVPIEEFVKDYAAGPPQGFQKAVGLFNKDTKGQIMKIQQELAEAIREIEQERPNQPIFIYVLVRRSDEELENMWNEHCAEEAKKKVETVS